MIQAWKSGKRINNNKKINERKERGWRRNEEELNNRLPYWICIVIEEPSKGLWSVSLKLHLPLHERLLAYAFYDYLLVWVIFACLFMYLPYFSSWIDDYRENLNLAMNTNHRKFSTKIWPLSSPISTFIKFTINCKKPQIKKRKRIHY